jgi:two-component system OmpR family sensor kinase
MNKRNSYRERIARRLTGVTAMIVLVVFVIIYLVVNYSVIQNSDKALLAEVEKHLREISLIDGVLIFSHKNEWEEAEHSTIQLNPIFIEIVDVQGNTMDRSPNLRGNHLNFLPDRTSRADALTIEIGNEEVRQMQIPLNHEGEIEGFMLVATSFEDSRHLLHNLLNILLFLYPAILISLFLAMRYFVGKSIAPIQKIIEATNQITQKNLNERVPLTEQMDEIGQLSGSINELLSRLEQSLTREKQFTSDASHELRTPLAVLRGTLEVLIRKPRTAEEYESKIMTALQSIDRMAEMMEQLLDLARVGKFSNSDYLSIDLIEFGHNFAQKMSQDCARQIHFETNLTLPLIFEVNTKSLQMILTNLLQNSIKYSGEDTLISIHVGIHQGSPYIAVEDQGVGIEEESLGRIFDPFFRETQLLEKPVPGTGLGLAIVRKLALESGILVEVQSQKGSGSIFRLIFQEKI